MGAEALEREQLSSPSSSSRGAIHRNSYSEDGKSTVYVYGLTNKVDDRHLDEIFGAYGRIARLRVRREDAESAIQHMDHGQIDGVYIRALLYEDSQLEDDRQAQDERRRDSSTRSRSLNQASYESDKRRNSNPSRYRYEESREQSREPY